jgi:hypothetical protein
MCHGRGRPTAFLRCSCVAWLLGLSSLRRSCASQLPQAPPPPPQQLRHHHARASHDRSPGAGWRLGGGGCVRRMSRVLCHRELWWWCWRHWRAAAWRRCISSSRADARSRQQPWLDLVLYTNQDLGRSTEKVPVGKCRAFIDTRTSCGSCVTFVAAPGEI